MNNRYLFRAKRTDTGEWVEGYYTELPRPMISVAGALYVCGWEWFDVDPATIGQCTGLRDRNGTLVFEGDILGLPGDVIGIVEWNSEYDQRGHTQNAGYVISFPNGEYYRNDLLFWVYDEDKDRVACSGIGVEVIGNIHDNPELLERTDNDAERV